MIHQFFFILSKHSDLAATILVIEPISYYTISLASDESCCFNDTSTGKHWE